MGTNQATDLHFMVQRGGDDLDADLRAVHGVTTHDIIQATLTAIGQSTTVGTDAVWTAANQVAVSSAPATAAALTMGASTMLARLAAGGIVAATPAQIKTLLAVVAADISDLTTAVRAGSSVAQFAAPVAALDMNGQKITGGATPTATTDYAIKSYVDALAAAGQLVKASCAVATTANITLSGEQTIDGVTTLLSRVLVKDQSTASQNGIYVSAAGAWTRATDCDAAAEFVNAFVAITGGTVGIGTSWQQVTPATINVGVTSIVWNLYSSPSSVQTTLTVINHPANFTLAAAEAGCHLECEKATTLTVTVPKNSTVSIPPGSMFDGHQDGAGAVAFAFESGANAFTAMGTTTRLQGSPFQLLKLHTDAWLLTGDLV